MERLYDEIGKKIKLAAYVTFIVEAVIAVLEGIAVPIILVNTVDDSFFMFLLGLPLGLLAIGIGILVAWVSSWLLYGFGELIDKVCDIKKMVEESNKKEASKAKREAHQEAQNFQREFAEKTRVASKTIGGKITSIKKTCPHCGEVVYSDRCEMCGKKIDLCDEQKQWETATSAAAVKSTTVKKAEELHNDNSPNLLKEKLLYSLKYTTDEGMVSYLSKLDDPRVKEILERPKSEVRNLVQILADSIE